MILMRLLPGVLNCELEALVSLFSLNFLGDGLRDALDVRNAKE